MFFSLWGWGHIHPTLLTLPYSQTYYSYDDSQTIFPVERQDWIIYDPTSACLSINTTGINTDYDYKSNLAPFKRPILGDRELECDVEITSSPSNSSICEGGNTSFSIEHNAPPSESPTYTWQLSTDGGIIWNDIANGGVYSNATTETLSISGATASMNGYKYRGKVTIDCGAYATSDEGVLVVVAQPAAPGLTKNPDVAEVCAGQALTVAITAGTGGTGTIADEYRFSTDNGTTWSLWSATVPNFAAVTGTNLIQSRRTANGTGCNTSSVNEVSWTVVDQPAAPDLTKNPDVAEVCAGQTLTVSVTAGSGGSGTITDEYRYSTNNGSTWSGWSTSEPSFAAVTGTNLIQSRRTATGTGCNTSSNEVSWTVVNQPSAPGLTKNPDVAEVCAGQTLTVSVTAGSGGSGTITDEYRYSTNNGSTWSGWSTSVPSFAAVTGTNLIQSRRTATGTGCNTSSNEVSWTVVNQPSAPGLTKNPDVAEVCAGQTLTVS
ncbi:MAG: hypothetical protein U1C46_04040, partial [Bacteroidales bacterium]|nr:hypothetical protein [Bacteroidales bacterium]